MKDSRTFFIPYLIILALYTVSPYSSIKADDSAVSMSQQQVKQLVEDLLRSKSDEIERMNKRISELEQLTHNQQKLIQQLQLKDPLSEQIVQDLENSSMSAKVVDAIKPSLNSFFFPDSQKITTATNDTTGEDEAPDISGFFDTTAQINEGTEQIFHIGVVELDLDKIFHHGDFAASVALDWFPYGTTPSVQIGAAFIDFHLYDQSIPVRGRIFQEAGFHLQVGQFDLPFGSDYQYFAVTDRLTLTPPMTTTRLQQSGNNPANGGFNSPGIRTYGKWHHLTYAVYAVDSIFSDGVALGTRLGFTLDPHFQLHKKSRLPLFDMGFSYLHDLNHSERTTDQVYAVDIALNYASFRLNSEFVYHDADVNRNDGNPAFNETAFHITLVHDLQTWLHDAFYVYSRYQQWNPEYSFVMQDNQQYAVNFIPAMSVGMGYQFNDFLTFKIEYTHTLGHQTDEPGFQNQTGIAQLIGSF